VTALACGLLKWQRYVDVQRGINAMSSSVIVNNDLFALLDCRAASNLEFSRSSAVGEARKAFADTPPMAELRRQSKSDRARSLEVSPECEAGGQQSTMDEVRSPEEQARPETREAVPDEAAEAATDVETAVASTSDTPSGSHATTDDGPAAQVASQSLMNNGDNASVGGSVQAGMPALTAEELADAAKAAALPGGGEGDDSLASEADPAVPNAGSAMPKDQVAGLGKPDGSVVGAKEAMTTPAVLDGSEAGRTPSGRQRADENASSPFLERQSPLSQEDTNSQSTPQLQAITADGPASAGPWLDTKEDISAQPEPVVPLQAGNVPVSESFGTQANAPSITETTLLRSPTGSLGTQILDQVQASLVRGDKQLLIRLDPPELGSVTVRFQEQRGVIEGILEVSRDQTRWELQEALPQALRSLQEAGIQIRRLDVVVSDQSDKEPARENWPQDGGAQEQDSDRREAGSQGLSAVPWANWAATQDNLLGREEGASSRIDAVNGRIDMLI
jgi:flagellar hook-length control protein FliK